MTENNQPKAKYSVANAQVAADAVEKARGTNKNWSDRRRAARLALQSSTTSWKRETHILSREDARVFARNFFRKYPKAAYWSEVENWRVIEGDMIEFTLRRLPSAD